MPLTPEIAQLIEATRNVVSQTHKLTTDMNKTLDDLEHFVAHRDKVLEEWDERE